MRARKRRTIGWRLASLGPALFLAGVCGACSNTAGDCKLTNSCGSAPSGAAGGGGGGATSCVPDQSSAMLPNSCGVWASSSQGTDGNAGIPIAPVRTLKHAIHQAVQEGTMRVYACAEEFPEEEALEVPAGITIFGGFDCANGWAWIGAGKRTTILGLTDAIAVKLLEGETTTRLMDVVVKAADGVTPGTSSIAVAARAVAVEIVRSELIAGNGADGAEGAPGAQPARPGDPVPVAQAGIGGIDGQPTCADVDGTPGPDLTVPGGMQVMTTCNSGETSIGGKGGDGTVTEGKDGSPGQYGPWGSPGLGEPSAGSGWGCTPGQGRANPGAPGEHGEPGAGATAESLGTLSLETGILGVSGSAGTPGKVGQGGGGGGGAKGISFCNLSFSGGGASAGSGGSGGCGGLPGQGGLAGGSSIALLYIDAQVSLTETALIAGHGGRGGKGGDYQPGGPGGDFGVGGPGVLGASNACNGGPGGAGGDGGAGGGGRGGHAFAIAFQGSPITDLGVTKTTGAAGEGGPGGNDNVAQNQGAAGVAADEQQF